MKIYLNSAKENWIVDRIRSEWYKLNKDVSTKQIYRSDIIWIISPWTWKSISINKLKQKRYFVPFITSTKKSSTIKS